MDYEEEIILNVRTSEAFSAIAPHLHFDFSLICTGITAKSPQGKVRTLIRGWRS
jgi:hypothetical protein